MIITYYSPQDSSFAFILSHFIRRTSVVDTMSHTGLL